MKGREEEKAHEKKRMKDKKRREERKTSEKSGHGIMRAPTKAFHHQIEFRPAAPASVD
jgi:hypothetical protein